MKALIIEAGSTITKIDEYTNGILTRINEKSIFFKKNYKENNKLLESDIQELINLVNSYKNKDTYIFTCGTSIFRNLNEEEKTHFLETFKKRTNLEFKIISTEEENKLTALGATRKIKDKKVCVFIGGGGSTEISILENGTIKSISNSNFGVIDAMEKYQNLNDDIATSSIEEIKSYIKGKLMLPTEKCELLILAGGAHKKFIDEAKIKHNINNLYNDKEAPYIMTNEERIEETKRFVYEISLEEIKSRVKDPAWWYAARMMCIFILVVMEEIEAKYIIPTDISMSYGIIERYLQNENIYNM